MPLMQKATRWIGAIGITLAPFCLFVLPALMYPAGGYETGEEQFRAMANGTGGGYPGQLVQIGGSIFFLAAVLGIGIFTIARGARVIGASSLGLGMVAAIALLVLMGFELAMMNVLFLVSETDVDAAVALVVDLVAGPAFVILLSAGLFGFFLTLPLLGFALWRSRVVPLVVPLLFALPLLIGFVPLPFDASLVSGFLLVAPCVWMTVNLIRGVPRGRTAAPTDADVSERRSHASS